MKLMGKLQTLSVLLNLDVMDNRLHSLPGTRSYHFRCTYEYIPSTSLCCAARGNKMVVHKIASVPGTRSSSYFRAATFVLQKKVENLLNHPYVSTSSTAKTGTTYISSRGFRYTHILLTNIYQWSDEQTCLELKKLIC
jgi:hypothetical protein